jgi:hypothetical protein
VLNTGDTNPNAMYECTDFKRINLKTSLDTKVCKQYFLHIYIFSWPDDSLYAIQNMWANSSIKLSCKDSFTMHFTSKKCLHCTYLLPQNKGRNTENQIATYYSANSSGTSTGAIFTVKWGTIFSITAVFSLLIPWPHLHCYTMKNLEV